MIESIPERMGNDKNTPRLGLNPFANGGDLVELGTCYRATGNSEKARAAFKAAKESFTAWIAKRPEEPEHWAQSLFAMQLLAAKRLR